MYFFRNVKSFLLDIFYPNFCPCCNKLIPWNAYLCEECTASVMSSHKDYCPFCGKQYQECLCETNLEYDYAIILSEYDGMTRSGILSLKKATSLNFAYFCGEQLGQKIMAHDRLQSYDLIVPVPMEKRKKWQRIIQPSEKIAKEIVLATNIPMRNDILSDNGTGRSQHTLSAKERAKNISQFSICDIDLTGYRIILCDDVLTTGSTMNACAKLLKEKGAEEVAVICPATTSLH